MEHGEFGEKVLKIANREMPSHRQIVMRAKFVDVMEELGMGTYKFVYSFDMSVNDPQMIGISVYTEQMTLEKARELAFEMAREFMKVM